MFKKILIPLDGSTLSEQILPYVSALAKRGGGSVVLLHVVDTTAIQDTGEVWVEMPSVKQAVDEQTTRARTYVDGMSTRLQADGLQVTTEIQSGSPATIIPAVIQSTGADLVAMSTHGRSGVERWVVGSITDRIIHEVSVPVLVYRPGEGGAHVGGIGNIVVPLDGSPMAEQALPIAESLARELSVPITLFRAVSTYTFAFAEPYPFGGAEATAEVLEAIEQEAEDYLAAKIQDLQGRGITASGKRVLGDPATQLVDLAHDTTDSLTVMTTHGRGGVVRTLLGSVADKVVRSSGHPVLLIHATE